MNDEKPPAGETAAGLKTNAADLIGGAAPVPTTAAATAAPGTPPADARGGGFDPAKHAVDAAGKPRFDSLGRFINRNAGRKSAAGSAPGKSVLHVPGSAPTAVLAEKIDVPARTAAEGVCALFYTLGAVFIGQEEWLPRDGEHEPLRDAWEHYFHVTGAKEMPAWIAPTFATLAFAQQRLAMPKTQTAVGKIKLWFVNWRARREGRKIAAGLPESTA